MNRQPQEIALPSPDRIGALVIRGVATFARRNKVVTGTYALGLLLLIIFGGGGRPLSPQQSAAYSRILDSIDFDVEYQATEAYWRARQSYEMTRGWFWSCDPLCQRNKKRMDDAERALNAVRRESAARTADAKQLAGLFSEIGIGEVQDSFWQYFNAGKQFAKRQTMWDAMFIGIRSMTRGRDESWLEFGLKVLMQVLLNFSMGLIMALIFFVVGLWSIVRSYQPNPIVAAIFLRSLHCGIQFCYYLPSRCLWCCRRRRICSLESCGISCKGATTRSTATATSTLRRRQATLRLTLTFSIPNLCLHSFVFIERKYFIFTTNSYVKL